MMMKKIFCLLVQWTIIQGAMAQQALPWKGKPAAVVLTYDDAIDVDLDHVLPSLDSVNLKGTFYLIGSSPVTAKRMAEWRVAAAHGHELGNHSLFHPCTGGPGRGFVTAENDLRNYTVARAVNEIRMMNTFLKAIDGKDKRTFAFPCGDVKIGDDYFYPQLVNDFEAARGVRGAMNALQDTDINNVDSYMINGQNAEYMIDLVKKAVETHSLVVFLFHGVGGGHSLNVDLKEHNRLLRYLKQHEKEVWVATMVEVAQHIKASRGR